MNIRKNYYSKDTLRGKIGGIHFKNISFSGGTNPKSILTGLNARHQIEEITFENVSIRGRKIMDAGSLNLTRNDFVHDIAFK